ncbi:MAG: penicillin-binding protein activator [Kiloniellales bacterium]|nr:penicillin-binding protein activator [Kiloniellales bacterium]MDJ0971637.1 penicillin-binding protein activator [Kiloniellales bacterium]
MNVITPRRRRSAGTLAVLALILAGCGGGKSGDPAPPPGSAAEPVLGSAQPQLSLDLPETGAGAVGRGPLTSGIDVSPILSKGQTRIGLLLPLSGPKAPLGAALLNAAQLALFDSRRSDVGLIIRDTKGTPAGAQAAALSALDEGAALLVGPFFATSVAAAAPQARARQVVVLAFSNDPAVAGNGVYLMGLPPAAQVDRVVAYASQQGLRRFAVLAPRSRYGNAVVAALSAAVARNGAELTKVGFFDPAERDVSAAVRQISDYDQRRVALERQKKSLESEGDGGEPDPEVVEQLERLETLDTLGEPGFDAVLLPLGGIRLQTIAPLLPFYDVDPKKVRFLGTNLWDDVKLSREAALVGGWFAAPPPSSWEGFRTRYLETYGSQPPRFSSLAYDATALAVLLVTRPEARGNPAAFAGRQITQPSGFSGIDGILRFLPNGLAERGLAVMEMRPGELEVVDPAPQSFQRLVN